VRSLVDATLAREARAFAFCFACEDCAHFDPKGPRCVHGYTERPSQSDLDPIGGVVTFCKEFELA